MGAILQGLLKPSTTKRDLYLVAGASAAATLTLVTLAKLALQSPPPPSSKVTPSPRRKVEALSKDDVDRLPYPPDVFPGARDVDSSYGSMRVYEWGPQEGKKVLLIHGITTPCVALGSVANALVEKGCRVMLFDLFGRGYSDSPSDLPHDARLYTTQILLALSSSTLSWTGDGAGFSVVGYSLGGGIAAEFASRCEDLVSELVLLAPSGLIRAHHFGWSSRAVYSPLVPTWLVNWAVGRRLRGASSSSSSSSATEKEDINNERANEEESEKVETTKIVHAEIKGNRDPRFESAILSHKRPDVTVASAVQWQVENHAGFVGSFVSSIRYAPIEGQYQTWKRLGARERKVIVVAGKSDAVIRCDELREDVLGLVGEQGIIWREVDGGHEFPITMGEEVVRIIGEVWGGW